MTNAKKYDHPLMINANAAYTGKNAQREKITNWYFWKIFWHWGFGFDL